jgi:tetratricopeptide (TPR) repeat protein
VDSPRLPTHQDLQSTDGWVRATEALHHALLGEEWDAYIQLAARMADPLGSLDSRKQALAFLENVRGQIPPTATPHGDLFLALGSAYGTEQPDFARSAFLEAERSYTAARNQAGLATARMRLGNLESDLGSYETADRIYRSALEVIGSHEDEELRGTLLDEIAMNDAERGLLDASEKGHLQALEIFERIGATSAQAICEAALSRLLRRKDKVEQAICHAQAGIDLLREQGKLPNAIHLASEAGGWALESGLAGEATSLYQTALSLASSDDPTGLRYPDEWRAGMHINLTAAYVQRGQPRSALAAIREALLLASTGSPIHDAASKWHRYLVDLPADQ